MALNLTKTYSQKSNAQADVRKAVKKGEVGAGDYTVVSLSGGFRIVPAVTQAPTSGSSISGFEPVNEDDAILAEITQETIADEMAMLNSVIPDEPIVTTADAERARMLAEAEAIIDAPEPDMSMSVENVATSPAGWRSPEPTGETPAGRWPADMTPGLARLRANENADAIRESVLADNEKAAEEVRAERETAKAAIQRVVQTAIANGSPVIEGKPANEAWRQGLIRDLEAKPRARPAPAPKAAKAADELSPEATALLKAVFYSPALRDLEPEAKVGKWIAYKTIHESDRPHGLAVKRVPGFMTTLSRRGLVECRAEKAGQYSACITEAGVALAQGAGR
jgi:hypothetical protein